MSPSVKPFNEAKYKALMDGLECSEIRFNEIHNWNPIFRIDAEFYNKRAITIDTQIRKMSHLCLNKEDTKQGTTNGFFCSEGCAFSLYYV